MSKKKAEISKEILNTDLYALLEVDENAHIKEIKKSYRKKALKVHPDKNPDNPKAADLFHKLSEALNILSDVGARAAYDHVRQARKAAAARTAKLDEGRKKVKLDLEAREKLAEEVMREEKTQARTLEQEINRLREEGSRILQEEQAAVQKLIKEEKMKASASASVRPARLKLRWYASKNDPSNGGYDKDLLLNIFSKYGDITALIVSSKKKGTAVIEYATEEQADLAYLSETGLSTNQIKVSWLEERPIKFTTKIQSQDVNEEQQTTQPADEDTDEVDFEMQVMKRMREAQERKRALEKAQALESS